jgi:hypothetical protein
VIALALLPGMDGTGELFAGLVGKLDSEVKTIVVSYPADSARDYVELERIARC